ncbi:MAG: hypothetical protein II820_08350 [Ruminiclostridium sp.]|nr:hypothetical protein [Ruminiclostridium sp.]
MKLKGKYSESAVLYAVLLSVAAVLSVVVFVVVLNLTGGSLPGIGTKPAETTTTAAETQPPEEKGYEPDRELADEMKDAVISLISDNYTVLRLYYIRGLSHKDEPYGNAPEDGYYTVDSDKYTNLSQIEDIVDRTFTKEFAEEIKTDPLGYGAIYKTRDNGELGIIANYTPMEYDRSWENPKFEIDPVSDTECGISLKLHEKADNSEVKVKANMIKTDDGWRLTSIIF